MTTSFAAQLRNIAAKSSNELDLRAQRDAHAISLIFERDVAIKQDWDTIYRICFEGFQELCLLDGRLREFERNLFSPQSKEQDRELLNRAQNEALDIVIEKCLFLLGSKLTLRPGIRTVEWLIRRFQIHTHNSSTLLATFLPLHETPVFQNILSIIPAASATGSWKFLGPYKNTLSPVPRHAIAYSAANLDGFFTTLNSYTIRACQNGAGHSSLISFWTSIVVEAVASRLRQAKSGRKEVERQRIEDALLKILPILEQGFEIRGCPEMNLTCSTIAMMLVANGQLQDTVVDSLMEAIANASQSTDSEIRSAIVCLTVMVAHKADTKVSNGLFNTISRWSQLPSIMAQLETQYHCHKLAVAMFNRGITGLKPKNHTKRIDLLKQLLHYIIEYAEVKTTAMCLETMINVIRTLKTSDGNEYKIRSELTNLLRQIVQHDSFSRVADVLLQGSNDYAAQLETLTMKTIQSKVETTTETIPMEDEPDSQQIDGVDFILEGLSGIDLPASFLQPNTNSQFEKVLDIFRFCESKEAMLDTFISSEAWGKPQDGFSTLTSSLLRIACGPHDFELQASALNALLKVGKSHPTLDMQAMLPYLTVCLADAAQAVRKAAVRFIMEKHNNQVQSGALKFYDTDLYQVYYMPQTTTKKVLEAVYQPTLEECVLDASQISRTLQRVFETSSNHASGASDHGLKKSHRHNLLDLLIDHAVATCLLSVKLRIIRLLDGVVKVGGTIKDRALAPILKHWSGLDVAAAERLAAEEKLSVGMIDQTVVDLVSVHDKEGIKSVLEMLRDPTVESRRSLVDALLVRLAQIWRDLKPEIQTYAALQLFDTAFAQSQVAKAVRSTLSSVPLNTDTLSNLLGRCIENITQLAGEPPSKKRKRSSQGQEGQVALINAELAPYIPRLIFVLEMVDGSKPESRPELLNELFLVLSTMTQLHTHHRADSPYLLNLCLTSILAITDRARAMTKATVDVSAIRVDLITDIVRSSENSSVISTSILVAASLAGLVPERMVHEIMPIFTFMSHNILEKDDNHSVHAINQAIDQIIPPVVATLKRRDPKNLIQSMSGLLSSFVAAYDHISRQRRIPFYQRFMQSLGIDDLGFAVIAVLAMRKSTSDSWKVFLSGILENLSTTSQLVVYEKLMSLTTSVFSEQSQDAEFLVDITASSSDSQKLQAAGLLFKTAEQILSSNNLAVKFRRTTYKVSETQDESGFQFRQSLLITLRVIHQLKQHTPQIVNQAQGCLTALLALPSLSVLIRTLPGTLEEMEELSMPQLKAEALRVLATELGTQAKKNKSAQSEALGFLATLNVIATTSTNMDLKLAAISCIDKVAEAYGRKDPEALMASANVLISESCLGSDSPITCSMALLCLASMLETLKEMAIPVVQQATPEVLTKLENSLKQNEHIEDLFSACISYLSSLISNIPFMLAEGDIDRLIVLLSNSADKFKHQSELSDERSQLITLVSQRIELSQLTSSILNCWDATVANGSSAVGSVLHILTTAVEHRSKDQVVQSSEAISGLLLHVMDLRRQRSGQTAGRPSLTTEEINEVERILNDLIIKFIYKLNDTAFQPLFETWVEWAVACRDLDQEYVGTAKILRQTTLFVVLGHFFDTLKSIVTSYASYTVGAAVAILQRFASLHEQQNRKQIISNEEWTLYTATLSMLTASFTHDADGFFNAPSHFSPLGDLVVNQLKLASRKNLVEGKAKIGSTETLIQPVLIALASATMETSSHHHSLNHQLCQLRHSDSAAVRLASIRAHLALTESDIVGDDWVSNVVGLGSEGGGGAAETMVYVNEMLEDDNEEVEREVRRWVQLVREKVGEDTFTI